MLVSRSYIGKAPPTLWTMMWIFLNVLRLVAIQSIGWCVAFWTKIAFVFLCIGVRGIFNLTGYHLIDIRLLIEWNVDIQWHWVSDACSCSWKMGMLSVILLSFHQLIQYNLAENREFSIATYSQLKSVYCLQHRSLVAHFWWAKIRALGSNWVQLN